MASTLVFWLFMAFLMGAMMAALMLGYSSTEKKRAQERMEQEKLAEARALAAARVTPRFFVSDSEAVRPESGGLNQAMRADLEIYLRAERAAVAKFIKEPSIDSLYSQGDGAAPSIN